MKSNDYRNFKDGIHYCKRLIDFTIPHRNFQICLGNAPRRDQ